MRLLTCSSDRAPGSPGVREGRALMGTILRLPTRARDALGLLGHALVQLDDRVEQLPRLPFLARAELRQADRESPRRKLTSGRTEATGCRDSRFTLALPRGSAESFFRGLPGHCSGVLPARTVERLLIASAAFPLREAHSVLGTRSIDDDRGFRCKKRTSVRSECTLHAPCLQEVLMKSTQLAERPRVLSASDSFR